jgi:3-methyladenine DNA glycosylase AlkD
MTHALVKEVRNRLRQAASPVRAAEMQRYMKSEMPYRGVAAPAQRLIWRTVFKAHPMASFAAWQAVALELWRGADYREERYAAVALTDLAAYAGYRTFAAVPMFEEMIVTGAWWDYVDALATHQLGDVLRVELAAGRGARMRSLLLRWARGPNLWRRRAAILCQVRFKSDTDLHLLYGCVEPSLLPERLEPTSAKATVGKRPARDIRHDFFIRKAIGWALRQYAWTDAEEVQRYVAAHRDRLSPLSLREALKNVGARKRAKR